MGQRLSEEGKCVDSVYCYLLLKKGKKGNEAQIDAHDPIARFSIDTLKELPRIPNRPHP